MTAQTSASLKADANSSDIGPGDDGRKVDSAEVEPTSAAPDSGDLDENEGEVEIGDSTDYQAAIAERTAAMIVEDPNYAKKPLAKLSADAAALQKSGDNVGAVAAYNKVFMKVKKGNITHKELYVVYGNRASVFLKLGT